MGLRYAVIGCLSALVVLFALSDCGCATKKDKPALNNASLVFPYLEREEDGAYSYMTGSFQGGTTVLGSRGDVYWVKDGKVYAANAQAAAAAPALPKIPANVNYEDLLESFGKS